ncbi:hypothetical protein [Salinadaptatus halalkaliphilus]|nr:hypothetical protein [Salinadaptatus halalkaliphilus]
MLLLSAILFGLLVGGFRLVLLVFVILGAVWLVLSPRNGLSIGTLGGRDDLTTDDPARLESEFTSKTPTNISMSGSVNTSLYAVNYTYHFVKANVVSVEQRASLYSRKAVVGVSLGVILSAIGFAQTVDGSAQAVGLVYFGGLVLLIGGSYPILKFRTLLNLFDSVRSAITVTFLLTYYSGILIGVSRLLSAEQGISRASAISDTASLVSGWFVLLGLLMTIYLYALPREGLLVSLPNGERLSFQVTPEDAKRAVNEFRKR